jgi:hypothetical protein
MFESMHHFIDLLPGSKEREVMSIGFKAAEGYKPSAASQSLRAPT